MASLHPSEAGHLRIFPLCHAVAGSELWNESMGGTDGPADPAAVPGILESVLGRTPPFLPDLARLELAREEVASLPSMASDEVNSLTVNPALRIVQSAFSGLPNYKGPGLGPEPTPAEGGREIVGVWKTGRGTIVSETMAREDLLALKIILEEIPREEVARQGGVSIGVIDHAMNRAVRRGLLISPPSRIRRSEDFPRGKNIPEGFFSTGAFTVQWHLTQACDLNCKHCYDRTSRLSMPRDKAISLLDEFRAFCLDRHVEGYISFSGGNPLLYPHFDELYAGAIEHGFGVGILGNPAPRERIEKILKIGKPYHYQISLEGLRDRNDEIRGAGHFDRALAFLDLLRELGVYSMVMLTLTRANLDDVIPLAELLKDRTDVFTFNRLSLVGEGARLAIPERADFERLLRDYHRLAGPESAITLKDNLFNIVRLEERLPFFGGCAGHGCSAAFNFLSLLPDGEVHACRKFPSLIGNVNENTLAEIYDSEAAKRYRRGCLACDDCTIRPVCGGCLAVSQSLGLDPFQEKDPFCFLKSAQP